MLGIAQLGNGSAVRKHPPVPRETEALAAGCSCSLLDMIEMPYVCSPKPGSIQQLVSAAWLSAGSEMKLPSLQPYSSRLLMPGCLQPLPVSKQQKLAVM